MPKHLKIVTGIFILSVTYWIGSSIPRLLAMRFDFELMKSLANIFLYLALIGGFQDRSRMVLRVTLAVISLALFCEGLSLLVLLSGSLCYSVAVDGDYLQMLALNFTLLLIHGYVLWALCSRPVKKFFSVQ